MKKYGAYLFIMTETEATNRAKTILNNETAVAFYDAESPMYPYLVAIETPTGETGVIASGRNYADALDKAQLWQSIQNRQQV